MVASNCLIESLIINSFSHEPDVLKSIKIGIKKLLKVEESWLNAGLEEFSERAGNIRDFCTKIINGENRLKEYLDYCQDSGE